MSDAATDRGDDPALLRFADLSLDPTRFKAWRNGRTILLSALQVQLLSLMMARPTHVFSRDELEQLLWQGRTLEMANLRTCFRRLRQALNAPGERELIGNVRQQGYVLYGDAAAL
ncbi:MULTISPECIES: winged helix-turn-helix domain-containing protein [Sphingomonas]|uniref:winged helix-turn-helix domain-containing protein n=1 Tax=Sphingomonas TaxID=13687 RepID=UPI0013B3E404|nr:MULTISPECIES: winged helix-turn-helix domain-containing protein [Sphingomonas]